MAPAASGRRMIMRLIDADALIEEALTEGAYGYVDALQIAITPTIDAMPVRHGQWETNSDRPDTLICSVCKCGFDMWKHDPHNFCPNCGAKMERCEDCEVSK